MKRIIALVCLLSSILPLFGRADAERMIMEKLSQAGLELGYDGENKRYLSVSVIRATIPNPSTFVAFDQKRSLMGKTAVLNARRDILYMRSVRVKTSDKVDYELCAKDSVKYTKSVIEQFASRKMIGCKTLCTTESYDAASGEYQVAAAVGWSEKVDANAERVWGGGGADSVDENQICEWLKNHDLSVMVGGRDFVSADGRAYCVGIGQADVEGLTGFKRVRAIRNAQMRALSELVFAYDLDVVASDVAIRVLKEWNFDGLESRTLWEKFVSEIMGRKHGRIQANEVHSVVLRHPITGTQKFISVYVRAGKCVSKDAIRAR